jgi:cytochrome c
MSLDDPAENLSGPRKVPAFVAYLVVGVGCLFAVFYAYQGSRENVLTSAVPAPSQTASSKLSPDVAEPSAPVTKPKLAAAVPEAPPTSAPAPIKEASPAPAAAQAPATSTPPTPSNGPQSAAAPRTAGGNEDLELAFNGHCRECHSFVKDDNRLGPTLYGVVGRKAGTVPNFAYSDSVKGSGITWDEPTLDRWITNPNALVPGNNMGTIFGGVADPAERKKIISFLKQDTQAAESTPSKPNIH